MKKKKKPRLNLHMSMTLWLPPWIHSLSLSFHNFNTLFYCCHNAFPCQLSTSSCSTTSARTTGSCSTTSSCTTNSCTTSSCTTNFYTSAYTSSASTNMEWKCPLVLALLGSPPTVFRPVLPPLV